MLVFWSLFSLVRNSVVLAVYLLFSVACFFTVHEHWRRGYRNRNLPASSPRPTRQGQRRGQQRGSAKCWWQKRKTAYSLWTAPDCADSTKKHLSRKIFRFKRSGAASAAPLQFLSGCAHDYNNRYKQRSFHPPPGKKRAYVCKCTLFSELRRNFQP